MNMWKKLEDRGAIDGYNTRAEAMDALVRDFLDSQAPIEDRLLLVHDQADAQVLRQKIAPFAELSPEQVKVVFDLCKDGPRTHWVGEGRQGMRK